MRLVAISVTSKLREAAVLGRESFIFFRLELRIHTNIFTSRFVDTEEVAKASANFADAAMRIFG